MKTSKITDALYETKWNDFNIYKLQLANGTSGKILTKSWVPQVGEELNYTYDVEKSRFKRINPEYQNKPQGSGNTYQSKGNTQDMIIRQVALKAAVDFSNGRNLKVDQVLKIADSFNDWVNKKQEAPEVQHQPSPSAAREAVQQESHDDLPF